jgi:hypothetical protein
MKQHPVTVCKLDVAGSIPAAGTIPPPPLSVEQGQNDKPPRRVSDREAGVLQRQTGGEPPVRWRQKLTEASRPKVRGALKLP